MIVNTEWGNFDKLKPTQYDRALDASSNNPGQQILEKMVSGMYLGELARRVINDMLSSKIGLIKDFKTEYMSIIEADSSPNLSKTGSALKKLGITKSSRIDRMLIKKTCRLVSRRAARISAAGIAAIVTKIDPKFAERHTIAVDGALYEKHPHFSKDIRSGLKELFGKRASRITLSLAKDGSGKGAAIIAAVAQ